MKTLFTLLFITAFSIAYSQSKGIDQSFGNKGFVVTPADSAQLFGVATAAALQPDGKILVSGMFLNTKMPELIRYMPDGAIDQSFGRNGIAVIDTFRAIINGDFIMAVKPIDADIRDIAVQPDGKIVVAGNIAGVINLFAARFLPDGKPDADFGNKGVFSNFDFSFNDRVSAIALQPDGKILISGGENSESYFFEGGVLIRLNADGSIDKSFANEGRFETKVDDHHENYVAVYNSAIVLQPDGKIVTTGNQYGGQFTSHNFVVSRYNTDGTPDSVFGKKGNAITKTKNFDDNPNSIAMQQDGKIVVGGWIALNPDTWAMTAFRYNTNGKLDRSFGKNGKVSIVFKDKKVRSCKALLQPNGKIILAGSVYSQKPKEEEDFVLCSINKDGTINTSFGINGKQVLASEQSNESFETALLQPDGKIVLVGYSWYSEHLTAVLARYDSIR